MSEKRKAEHTGDVAELIESTIGQRLDEVTARDPSHPAIVVPHQSVRWSYAEFNAAVDKFAAGLLKIGIESGDRVGIWSPNRIEWVLTQFATAKIGAIMVCINPAYRLYELEYALNKVSCKALVTAEQFKSSRYLDMLTELAPELRTSEPGSLQSKKLPHLRTVIRMGEDKTPGMLNFDNVMDLSGEKELNEVASIGKRLNADDAINIQFTSGTTGAPKGATLSHKGILNNAHFAGVTMRISPADKLCIPVPLYHCFGMVVGTLMCVSHGATMVLPAEAFEPEATLKAVSEERCTALHGVPTMFFAELDSPNFQIYDLSSLRTGAIGGSSCPMNLMKRLISEMGLNEIVIIYGQTECSPINAMTTIDDPLQKRVSTVGRAHLNWEQKIIRADGSTVDVGEQGEICSRGYGVMQGYWGDDAQTHETIDEDGFLHSGDLGEMDEEGYVKVTGRIKDMIIRGGENVYPREVEDFLCTHPDIAEAQVFGIPDEKYGEQVCAWVKVRSNSKLTQECVTSFCNGQITHFKIPKHIKFVDEYPMTVTGKMQKFKMRDKTIDELLG
ncbi:MAG: AMP-binding protein [Marinicaulis sp.]|nr:AMP-binding protein [Marinicaulis sp.]